VTVFSVSLDVAQLVVLGGVGYVYRRAMLCQDPGIFDIKMLMIRASWFSVAVWDICRGLTPIPRYAWNVYVMYLTYLWWKNGGGKHSKTVIRTLGDRSKQIIDNMVRHMTRSPIPTPTS